MPFCNCLMMPNRKIQLGASMLTCPGVLDSIISTSTVWDQRGSSQGADLRSGMWRTASRGFILGAARCIKEVTLSADLHCWSRVKASVGTTSWLTPKANLRRYRQETCWVRFPFTQTGRSESVKGAKTTMESVGPHVLLQLDSIFQMHCHLIAYFA